MNRSQYDAYLNLFNSRDYDGVTSHFKHDAVIAFADIRLRGHDAIRRFYAFFHDHVSEQIRVNRFLSDDRSVMLEAVVRLEGKKRLTPEAIENHGYASILPLEKGQVIEIPQFIHYHLDGGEFSTALCAIATFEI
ncbi:MAG TPA: nuclear transport factor 2 family protein [Sphingobium sp.]|nr:nuclear transport factor 2 family protein [Sphingobium sp.]